MPQLCQCLIPLCPAYGSLICASASKTMLPTVNPIYNYGLQRVRCLLSAYSWKSVQSWRNLDSSLTSRFVMQLCCKRSCSQDTPYRAIHSLAVQVKWPHCKLSIRHQIQGFASFCHASIIISFKTPTVSRTLPDHTAITCLCVCKACMFSSIFHRLFVAMLSLPRAHSFKWPCDSPRLSSLSTWNWIRGWVPVGFTYTDVIIVIMCRNGLQGGQPAYSVERWLLFGVMVGDV
jgi:hypothetical protein